LEKPQPLPSSIILPRSWDAGLGDASLGEQPPATVTRSPQWPASENDQLIRWRGYFKQLFVLENKYLHWDTGRNWKNQISFQWWLYLTFITQEFYTPSQWIFPSKSFVTVRFPHQILHGAPCKPPLGRTTHPGCAVSTAAGTAGCMGCFATAVANQKPPDTRKETFHFSRGSRTVSKHELVWSSESLFYLLPGSLAKILVNGSFPVGAKLDPVVQGSSLRLPIAPLLS